MKLNSIPDLFLRALRYLYKHPFLLFFGLVLGAHQSVTLVPDESISSAEQLPPEQVSFLIGSSWEKILIGALIFFLVALAVWIIRAWMLAGIIDATHSLSRKKKTGCFQSLARTWKKARKIILLQFLFSLAVGILLIVLGTPIVMFWGMQETKTAIVLGVVAIILFVSITAILTLSFRFGMMYAVLGRLKLRPALDAGYALFITYSSQSIFFLIFLILFEIIFSALLSLFPALVLHGNLTLSIQPFVSTSVFGVYTVCAIAILSVFFAFKNVSWVLFFIQIAKQKRLKETAKEALPAPEITKKEVEPVGNVE